MKRWIAIALIGFGAVVIGLVLGGYLYNNWLVENPGRAPLPDQLVGLQLAGSTYGAEAVHEIERLHNQDFAITRGATANYGTENAALLWVGGTLLPFQAGEVLEAMRAGLNEGRFPFVPQGELNQNGTTIYAMEGPGQLHYYFNSGSYIVWLAVDPDLAEQALDEILDFYD